MIPDGIDRGDLPSVDTLSPSERSRRMALVRSKDTKPEKAVRSLTHGLGYRFRLHRRDLPGTPDLVFPVRRKVIFVHGCFWHGHECRLGARAPKSRTDFWAAKIASNKHRDTRSQMALREKGWKALVVWECQIKDAARLVTRVKDFLDA
jgi:DNA mismatch endonuclease (patch repair protein)